MDLFDAIVEGVADTDDEGAAAVARVDASGIRGPDAVSEMVRRGLVAAAQGLDAQLAVVLAMTEREGEALKSQDARSVRAITNADIAAARAKRVAVNQDKEGRD